MSSHFWLFLLVTLLVTICAFIPVAPVLAMVVPVPTKIILDSQFTDWYGQKNITDPAGDATAWGADFTAFYWANNSNDSTCYWMLQRKTSQRNVEYLVYFDTNNNGNFSEHVDRVVVVFYDPLKNTSNVNVEVRYADNWQLISSSNNNDWGESLTEGATKVEFGASFADLGFGTGQTIRMYAVSFTAHTDDVVDNTKTEDDSNSSEFNSNGEDNQAVNVDNNSSRITLPADRIPDKGDIQWSPVPLLGYPLLIVVVVSGVILIWYFKGRHLWPSV